MFVNRRQENLFALAAFLLTIVKISRYLFHRELFLFVQLGQIVLLCLFGVWIYRELLKQALIKILSFKALLWIGTFFLLDILIANLAAVFPALLAPFFGVTSEGVTNTHALSRLVELVPMPLIFLVIGILGPILEELFYRHWLLSTLNCKVPIWLAIMLQGFLFGLAHMSAFTLAELFASFPYIATGIYYGILYHKTGNLAYPILLHCLNNISISYT